MDTNSAEGAVKEVAGKVQARGRRVVTPAPRSPARPRELSGKAQQLCASTTGLVRDTTVESPFTDAAVVALAGFVAAPCGRAARPDRDYRR